VATVPKKALHIWLTTKRSFAVRSFANPSKSDPNVLMVRPRPIQSSRERGAHPARTAINLGTGRIHGCTLVVSWVANR
jgi:hypothetical protein